MKRALYGSLLLLLLIYPHIIENHIFLTKNTARTSTIINFIIISLGIAIYVHHQRQIDVISKQKHTIEWNLEKSYEHIGIINGSIDIIKETIERLRKGKYHQKEIIHRLLFIIKKIETK